MGIRNEFRHRADNQIRIAREHMSAFPEMMLNLQNIASFSQPVFRAVLEDSFENLVSRHPSITILEWVHRVEHNQRTALELRQQRRFGESFQIRHRQSDGTFVPAPEQDFYYPILVAVPMTGNEDVLGYDRRSGPTISFLEKARESGEMVTTPQFVLAQQSGPEDLLAINMSPPMVDRIERETKAFEGLCSAFSKSMHLFPKSTAPPSMRRYLSTTLTPQPGRTSDGSCMRIARANSFL